MRPFKGYTRIPSEETPTKSALLTYKLRYKFHTNIPLFLLYYSHSFLFLASYFLLNPLLPSLNSYHCPRSTFPKNTIILLKPILGLSCSWSLFNICYWWPFPVSNSSYFVYALFLSLYTCKLLFFLFYYYTPSLGLSEVE